MSPSNIQSLRLHLHLFFLILITVLHSPNFQRFMYTLYYNSFPQFAFAHFPYLNRSEFLCFEEWKKKIKCLTLILQCKYCFPFNGFMKLLVPGCFFQLYSDDSLTLTNYYWICHTWEKWHCYNFCEKSLDPHDVSYFKLMIYHYIIIEIYSY